MFDVWCFMCIFFWYLMFDVWCWMLDIWCMILFAWFLILDSKGPCFMLLASFLFLHYFFFIVWCKYRILSMDFLCLIKFLHCLCETRLTVFCLTPVPCQYFHENNFQILKKLSHTKFEIDSDRNQIDPKLGK